MSSSMEVPVAAPRPRSRSPADGEHHVHFSAAGSDEDVLPPAHGVDVVASAAGDSVSIHAGFLKALHQYRVTCRVPLVCHEWEVGDVPALHWKVRQMRPLDGAATELTLQVVAHKEKLLREKLQMRNPSNGKTVTFELNARILGKDTGTPFLRDGVHLESVIKEDEGSEASDWRGFD